MNYTPPSPEITPRKRGVDTLSPLFEQVWGDSDTDETSRLPTQDLLKLAQNLMKVQQDHNTEKPLTNPLLSAMSTEDLEKYQDQQALTKTEACALLNLPPADSDQKVFSSHEEMTMHSPESLPGSNDEAVPEGTLDGSDSDETSSLMECIKYVPIPLALSQPPTLAASPYDDVVGLCYIDHCLNGVLRKDVVIDCKTRQTLRQLVEEVAYLHQQVNESFTKLAYRIEKLKQTNSCTSQSLKLLLHNSDTMQGRVCHLQAQVKAVKSVKRVVSFSELCEVISVPTELPPVKTLSGSSLRAAIHRQRSASYRNAALVSPLQHKRRGVPFQNSPSRANTSEVSPTMFELDSDEDGTFMEPYRISRAGSCQNLSQYAHPHSPTSPYYEKPQPFTKEAASPSPSPPSPPPRRRPCGNNEDEPVKIRYILLLLLLYFYNKLHNYFQSKV
ncbi:hypothetical protein KGF57_002331 [Candida theae]|uniref:Uncharacterized protein n=1 Tax=Candida theae TaxID=1198502 RepID=A0AAD5FZ05_9ASCO|nr:uncharacterized protein KGF57_002331 [Candida theae]KAI5958897.1 hypothetical protein KGF57_002331 [Candida theae]